MKLTISGQITILLDDATLLFVPNSNMPQAVPGQAYPPTSVGTVSQGIPPYTFSNLQGAPAGMSLSSSGVLSGTPSGANGQYTLTFDIEDSTP